MSWVRQPVADALVAILADTLGGLVSVFDRPPLSLNAPSIVVGRVVQVEYNRDTFGLDVATLPVICVGGMDSDGDIDDMKLAVRDAVMVDRTLGGVVADTVPTEERNWRNIAVSGAELLAVDLILEIRM
jgi:hypothetical protein